MKTADEIVGLVEQKVGSSASGDEVLRYAVEVLKREREHYNWVGIYMIEGTCLFSTTTLANRQSTPISR